MSIPAANWPLWVELLALACYLPLLFMACRWTNWKRFRSEDMADFGHLFGGFCVLMGLCWTARAVLDDAVAFHMLGVSLATLVFGLRLTIILLSTASGFAVGVGVVQLEHLPTFLLLNGALPATITRVWLHGVEKWIGRHLFIYIFATGFVGAGVAIYASGLSMSVLAIASGLMGWEFFTEHYLVGFLAMGYAEASMTAMIIGVLVVYRHQWVHTFDDRVYLRRR